MCWDAVGFWKIYGATIQQKLSENVWRRICGEYPAYGLDHGYGIQKFRKKPAPDVCGGSAEEKDMLCGVQGCLTEDTSRAEVGLVK